MLPPTITAPASYFLFVILYTDALCSVRVRHCNPLFLIDNTKHRDLPFNVRAGKTRRLKAQRKRLVQPTTCVHKTKSRSSAISFRVWTRYSRNSAASSLLSCCGAKQTNKCMYVWNVRGSSAFVFGFMICTRCLKETLVYREPSIILRRSLRLHFSATAPQYSRNASPVWQGFPSSTMSSRPSISPPNLVTGASLHWPSSALRHTARGEYISSTSVDPVCFISYSASYWRFL